MNISVISKVLGIFLMLFSISMALPFFISLYYADDSHLGFARAFFITLISGAMLWLPVYKEKGDLRVRDGFIVTTLFWLVLGIYGSIPLLLEDDMDISFADALFESISGLTTTGATVITGLDNLPPSILFYRQFLQWLGGIGIIVIALAVLPMLGVGGMQLYRAETPGPMKDSKLTPRITGTAKALFLMYFGMTLACAIGYWLAGMTVFDAICHSFSTVAIGGFSTHDASIGYFDNPAIMAVAVVFMLMAGVNFALHFFAFRERSLNHYRYDPEFRFYILTLFIGVVVVCSHLYNTQTYSGSDAMLHGIFQLVSIATTTGFASQDFSVWPSFLPVLLLFFALIGGCAGSTAGGVKSIRAMLIIRQGYRELQQLAHPNAVIPLKIGNRIVEGRIISAVWSFFAVYLFSFTVLFLLVLATGVDFITSFSAVAATISNLGPGLGEVTANYGSIPDTTKFILCFSMLLGRLEVFTLLVLFTPNFWRR
jgi:trk system potassium uptake protein TrkH